MTIEEYNRKDPIEKYYQWNSIDVNENANKYLGPSGFFSFLLEEYMKELVHIMPKPVLKMHLDGYIYVHKLPYSIYIPYCTGHSVSRILELGLKTPTICSKPAKHFDTYVDHLANYLITLQHYFTGAQALSSVEWYAGPFVRKDSLTIREIRQNIQRLLFNLNYPTRVGMQCLSEDTRILTLSGWRNYREISEGDYIYTLNLKTGELEVKPVKKIAVYEYRGKMYRLKSRSQDQLISPNHRIVWLMSSSRRTVGFNPIEELLDKNPLIVPTTSFPVNNNRDSSTPDDIVKLLATYYSSSLGLGFVEGKKKVLKRIVFKQSRGSHELKNLLDSFGLKYRVKNSKRSNYEYIILTSDSTKKFYELIGMNKIGECTWIYSLSRRQARLFIDTYLTNNGFVEYRGGSIRKRVLTASNNVVRDILTAVSVLAGYNPIVKTRIAKQGRGEKYYIVLYENKEEVIREISEVEYSGVIWSVNTDNETVIAERNGTVFITGNTPFTNFTITLDAPVKMLKEDYAIYSGSRDEPLETYYDEAREFFIALSKLYYEGDSVGQPFTFPIPTLMTTARMIWEDPEIHEYIFKTSATKGSFYWLNTRVVDPDASFAMCLHRDEQIIFRYNNVVDVITIGELFEKFADMLEAKDIDGAEWYSVNGEVEVFAYNHNTNAVTWRRVKRFLVKKANKAIRIELADGRAFIVTHDHPLLIKRMNENKTRLVKASDLLRIRTKQGVLQYQIPIVLSEIQTSSDYVKLASSHDNIEIVVDEAFGYLLGLYYGIGAVTKDSSGVEKVSEEPLRDCYYPFELDFSDSPDEDMVINFTTDYGAKLGCSIRTWRGSDWSDIRYKALEDTELAKLLHDNGVSPYSDEKHIPWFIWTSPLSVRKAFIKGIIDSNKCRRKRNWELLVENRKFAQELLLLSSITGVNAYLKENKNNNSVLYFPELENRINIDQDNLWKHHESIGDVAWVSISNVEETEFTNNELFIDIELEEDHYFIHSSGVVTHNCCRLAINRNDLVITNNNYILRKDFEEIGEEFTRKIEKQRFGGVWAVPDITGSINVTTINLPRLALESRSNDNKFWELYSNVLEIVKKAELWFRERYISLMSKYPGMYSMIKWYLREFPNTHFNTVGLIGLPEAAAIYLQNPTLWREGSRRDWLRAASVMDKMIEYAVSRVRDWMIETGIPWNVEEVPGESAAAKLAIVDSKLYPELLSYFDDPNYLVYSSSIVPYYGSLDLSNRIEIESMLQKKFTGGVMMHIFLDEMPDPEALAKLTKRLIDTDLVYWSYTPAVTHCNTCGKTFTGLYLECPVCSSSNVDIWSRIVGYYRPVRNWNPHRRREFWSRKHYKVL